MLAIATVITKNQGFMYLTGRVYRNIALAVTGFSIAANATLDSGIFFTTDNLASLAAEETFLEGTATLTLQGGGTI